MNAEMIASPCWGVTHAECWADISSGVVNLFALMPFPV
jgi:hypothetical protein